MMDDELIDPLPAFIIHHSAFILSGYLWLFCSRQQKSHKLKGVTQSGHAAPAIVNLRFCGS
jgi:hypothetical protein